MITICYYVLYWDGILGVSEYRTWSIQHLSRMGRDGLNAILNRETVWREHPIYLCNLVYRPPSAYKCQCRPQASISIIYA
jgi:hypothetical protein